MTRKYRTPRSIRKRRHRRIAERSISRPVYQSRSKRTRRSVLDLLFLPPFLIVEELIERLREALHVD